MGKSIMDKIFSSFSSIKTTDNSNNDYLSSILERKRDDDNKTDNLYLF